MSFVNCIGFMKPTMKQYKSSNSLCDVSLDFNYGFPVTSTATSLLSSSSSFQSNVTFEVQQWNGIDVSSPTSLKFFECAKQKGIKYVSLRAWKSNCQPDANVIKSIQYAREANFTYIDIYVFPSFKCKLSARNQIHHTIELLRSHSLSFNHLWIAVVDGSSHLSRKSVNDWLTSAVDEATTLLSPSRVGIYSSAHHWNHLMGSHSAGFEDLPLWFSHYDGIRSGGFESFGNWEHGAVKQYKGNVQLCGLHVDRNFGYPLDNEEQEQDQEEE